MNNAIGVKSPKKITPRTIGLTIMPIRSPNRIHSLFSGINESLFTNVITKIVDDAVTNTHTKAIFKERQSAGASMADIQPMEMVS